MQGWQTTYLGMRELPRDISGFELQAFFTFSRTERELIDARRGDALKLGLALHIGFLRMSGRVLDAFRIVPPALWRHLGNELGIDAPEIASLRALYGRGRTLLDHQQVACEALGFRWMTEHQRRALVRLMSDEVRRCADREQLLVFARRWLYEHRLLDRTPNCGHHDLREALSTAGRFGSSQATEPNRPAVVNALLAMGTMPQFAFPSRRASAARIGLAARTRATSAFVACCSSRCSRGSPASLRHGS